MDYSQITHKLFVGTTPKTKDYELLHDLGVTLVINMRIGTTSQARVRFKKSCFQGRLVRRRAEEISKILQRPRFAGK